MKKQKIIIMRIFTIIISFILLFSMFISVDASDNVEDIKAVVPNASDVSGEVSIAGKIFGIIQIIKWIIFITTWIVAVIGVISFINKQTKKGIICIIIAIILFCITGVFDIVFHAPINIQP